MMKAITTVNQSMVTAQDYSFDHLMNEWLNFVDVKPKSLLTYTKALRQFEKYLAANNIASPSAADVKVWRDSLVAENKSPATVNLYLTALKQFFSFLNQQGLSTVNISHVKGMKLTAEHKRDALTQSQGKDVLVTFDTATLAGARDKAIVSVMMICGLRSVEVSRLRVGDIVKSYGRVGLLVTGKGRDSKEMVMLPSKVEKLIRNYLQLRGETKADDFLFASRSRNNFNGQMSTDTISRIAKAAMRRAGYDSPRLTCHSLRHSAATAMLVSGVRLEAVKQILRHRKLDTTLIYSHHLDRLKNHGEDIAADVFL